MNKILYLLIVATCLSTLAHSQNDIYNSTFGRTISGGTVLDIQYSPDQMYIALILNNQVILHDGVTALPKYYVPYSTNFLYSSFSFSQDSNLFAVGFVSTDGSNFVKMFTPRKAQQLMTIRLPVGDNAAITVKSLCFTADNSRLIYSTSQGEIFAYKISERTFKSIKFGDIPASTIACSPTRSLQFAAGGSNTDGKQSKLSLYNINPVDNTILPAVHDFVLSDLDETVTSITYSGSGTYLYRSGSKQVYRNNVNEPYAEEIIIAAKDELKDFVKIRVTQKDDVLGVSTKLKQLHLVKSVPDANARVEQTLMMSIPGFGLSPNSLNLMYMTSGVTAQVSSQCKTTQILNPDGTCVDCNNNCQMCLDSVNTCRSCYTSFYLSETTNKCESCVARCKGCLDGKSCVICADPFVLSSTKQCVCGSGKFINGNTCSACKQNCRSCTSETTCSVCQGGYFAEENTCKTCAEGCLSCSDLKTCTTCTEDYELENGVCETKGFPTWAIILLVVLALSVVIIVAGVVYIKMRKQKRSPLLTDSDEAASNLE